VHVYFGQLIKSVTVGKPDRQVDKASHCGSKQQ